MTPRWWMRLLASALALAGCGCTRAPEMSVTRTPDGMDVFITDEAFHARWPTVPHGWAFDEPTAAGSSVHVTRGIYDPATHSCWVVTANPQHPSRDEQYVMGHEHAHRVQDLHGFEASAPLWSILPADYRTHESINARLRSEGWIP